MRLVTPPLVVAEEDGFKNDILRREDYGKSLLNLVTRSTDELVISLDGRWGEGKTTFIKMWQGLLNEANVPNVYIDAFANDYIDDAFIAVASAITNYADDHTDLADRKKVTDFKEITKKVGYQLLSVATKAALNATTLGALSSIDFSKTTAEEVAKDIAKIGSDFLEERLNSHAKDVELLSNFKTLLTEVSRQLGKEKGKPLIIIIDELDRCKPTYAVEVIEKIKHLFAVKNVVFVLVMNKKQLEESIRCVYGQEIDAHTYLQKFINLETTIPKRIEDTDIDKNDIQRYCHRLLELHEIETWGEANELMVCTESLAIHFNVSLRQLEKVFTNIAMFYATSEKDDFRSPPLIAFLSVIKVHNPPLFNDLLYNKAHHRQVLERSTLPLQDDLPDKGLGAVVTWIKFSFMERTKDIEDWNDVAITRVRKGLGPHLNSENRRLLMANISKKLNMFNTIGNSSYSFK